MKVIDPLPSTPPMATEGSNNGAELNFPPEITAKLRQIAEESNCSYDEAVNAAVKAFFEMLDDPEKKNVPSFVEKVRNLLRDKPEGGSTTQAD
jgi:hypothetical protein